MKQADHECVKQSLNGRPEAYGQLVQRYQDPLLSFLAGRLGDREAAEEAAQETFVRAFFTLRKLRETGSFFSWLLGIANRVAKEQHRARRRHREVVSRPPRSSVSPEAPDDELRQAVAGLPQPYAEVILLRYYSGLSCAEVARQLGLPLGTVTKRLSRAYSMLRETLRQPDRGRVRSEVQL